MSSDHRLGSQFSACIKSVNPDSQQKLSALLNDVAGSDSELVSAFRLLFSNPVYVSLFLSQAPLRAAELASLKSIAQSSLSSALAVRVEEFVRGYFDLDTETHSVPIASSPASRDQAFEPNQYSTPSYSRNFNSPRDVQEEVTLFADDTPNDVISSSRSASASAPQDTPRSGKKSPLKAILVLILLAVLGVSIFKVRAICEPFGLCAKEKDSGRNEDDKESINSSPKPLATPEPSKGNPPEPLRPANKVEQTAPSNPQPKSQSTPPPSRYPQTNQPQLRDEPLW
jgi:hypothetical protein